MKIRERRRRRSSDLGEALRLQLDAGRAGSPIEAMILADDDGLCVASSGQAEVEEIAAHLALVGRKAGDFEGVLLAPVRGYPVRIRRFQAAGTTLYLCAVGGGRERGARLEASIGGVTRILAAA